MRTLRSMISIALILIAAIVLVDCKGKGKDEAGERSIEDAYTLYTWGLELIDRDKPDEAFEKFQRAIELDPTNSEVYHQLGNYYYRYKRDFNKAIENYKKAVEYNEEYWQSWNNLGSIYYKMGEAEKAIQAWERAIEVNPNSYFAMENLGLAYTHKGDFDTALRYYRECINIDPNIKSVYYHLAQMYAKAGDFPMAKQAANEILKNNPYDPFAKNIMGDIYFAEGKYDKALKEYRDVIKIRPNNARPYITAAFLISETGGDLKEAEKMLLKAKGMTPSLDYLVDNKLGWVYYKMGKYEQALELFDISLQKTPQGDILTQSEIYYHKGMALLKLSKIPEAKESFNLAIEKLPQGEFAQEARQELGKLN